MGFWVPHRIVGLDIGTDTIKAVQVTTGFKGNVITGFAKKKRDGNRSEDPVAALSAEIRSMLDEGSMEGDVFVSSISCNCVAVRNLRLPFPNLNKVRQVIKYEVESVLPFPLDDILVDFSVVDKRPKGGMDLLIMAVPKEVVERHLEVMKGAFIEPEVVDIDSASLFYCLETMEDDRKGRTISIIDVGVKKSSVCIVREGVLRFFRSIPVGGEAISKAISEELSISLGTAEDLKTKKGIILLEDLKYGDNAIERDRVDLRMSRAITQTLDRLKRDLALSFSFYGTLYSDEKVTEILLTGGTSSIGNIDKYFEREFDIKTSLFSPLQDIPNSIGDIGRSDESIMTGAMGLALGCAKRSGPGLNFRKEEYSFKRKYADIRKDLLFMLVGLSLVFSLFLGNLFTDRYLKESRYAKIKGEIRNVFTKTFPNVKNIVNEVQQMKNEIREEKGRGVSFHGLHGNISCSDILREVSVRIPAGKETKITRMRISNGNISIAGEAKSFDTVEKMKSSFKESRLLKKVEIKDAKMSTRKGVVSFDFKMTIVD